MRARLSAPSPALVIAILALFVALGGGAYAAKTAKKNSVVSKSIRSGAVKSDEIADGTIQGVDVAPNTLGGAQTDEASLDAQAIPGAKQQPFVALLGKNESKTLTVGTFTFRETATNNALCDNLAISAGPKAAVGYYSNPNGAFPIPANTTVAPASLGNQRALFATLDGSEVAGLDFSLPTGQDSKCLFFGYLSGG